MLPPADTWWGYLAYSALVLALLSWLLWMRAWRLRRSRSAIESAVRLRTEELEQSSAELKLANRHLTSQVRAARRASRARIDFENRIQQSQRLESLGVLAGGIAHDFNNLLVGVLGSAELAERELGPGNPVERHLKNIVRSAERAADLCNQMLAYAGKAPFRTTELDVSSMVEGLTPLLETSVASEIEVECRLEEVPMIGGDRSQLEQLIMNLVTNAAEAIGDQPGRISIRSGTELCDEAFLSAHPVPYETAPGEYCFLDVVDDGPGMSDEIRHKIFEPFFTTKFLGRGLGLAAVFGIVRRHQGLILIDTDEGAGSSFRVLLPIRSVEDTARIVHRDPHQLRLIDPEDTGTVLIVDDESMVRDLARKALEREGFAAVVAEDGAAGISALRYLGEEIRCVLLDVSMPRMDGGAALDEMKRIAPHIPIVIMSGHSEDSVHDLFEGEGVQHFLHKPFAIDQLHGTVRRAMGLGA